MKSHHLRKFNFTSLRLTSYYVAIIMFISISFSIFVYNFASVELNRGLGKQLKAYNSMGAISLADKLEAIRLEQLSESNDRLKLNLVYYNLLILILSSIGGFFLARKSLRPIEESLEEQSRFTADASHELRTPITAMKTEIEVALRDEKLQLKEAKDVLASNIEELDKLESLSNALLKLAHAENAKLEFKNILVSDVVNESIKKINKLAQRKEIAIESEVGAGLYVFGDKYSLAELLVILIDNAVKYSPKESVIIVKAYEDKKKVYILVKDHGLGIKASDLPYIFNRFYRADNSRNKEKVDGYGLGLSIANQIVDLHDAQIKVNSKNGEGSEFLVVFPSFK